MGVQAQQAPVGDVVPARSEVTEAIQTQSLAELAGLWLSCAGQDQELDAIAVGECGEVTFKSKPDQVWNLVISVGDPPGSFLLCGSTPKLPACSGRVSYERLEDGVERLVLDTSLRWCGEFWQKIAPPGMGTMRLASRRSSTVTGSGSPFRNVPFDINLGNLTGRWIVEKEAEPTTMVLVLESGELAFVGNPVIDGIAICQDINQAGCFTMRTADGKDMGCLRFRRLSDGTDCLCVDRMGAVEREYWRRASAPGTNGLEDSEVTSPVEGIIDAAIADATPALPHMEDPLAGPLSKLAGRWQGWKDGVSQGVVLLGSNGIVRFDDEEDSELMDDDDMQIVLAKEGDKAFYKIVSGDGSVLLSLRLQTDKDGVEYLHVGDSGVGSNPAEVWTKVAPAKGGHAESYDDSKAQPELMLEKTLSDPLVSTFDSLKLAALAAEIAPAPVRKLAGRWHALTDTGQKGVIEVAESGELTFVGYNVVGLRFVEAEGMLATYHMMGDDGEPLCSLSHTHAKNGDEFLYIAITPHGGSEVWQKAQQPTEDNSWPMQRLASRPKRKGPPPSEALRRLAGRWVAMQGEKSMGMVLVNDTGELTFIGEPEVADLNLIDAFTPKADAAYAMVCMDDEQVVAWLRHCQTDVLVECLEVQATITELREYWYRVSSDDASMPASPVSRIGNDQLKLAKDSHKSKSPAGGCSPLRSARRRMTKDMDLFLMADEMEAVKQNFRSWDASGHGRIDRQQLIRVLQILEPTFAVEALSGLLEQSGERGDEVDLERFLDWLIFPSLQCPARSMEPVRA